MLSDLVATLATLGLSVEQLHGESGPGQFEVALGHSPAAAAADALLFAREALGAVAAKHGLVATCLPKLYADAAGNGMHVHFSLWRGGENMLRHEPPPAGAATGTPAAPPAPVAPGAPALPGLSADGEAFLAGVLRHLPALMLFTAPSPNSYRRIAPSFWSGAFTVRRQRLLVLGAPVAG